MVTKEDLRDWLDEDARKRYAKVLERIFDNAIKTNALNGRTTFLINTGRVNNAVGRHEKTEFYRIWHTEDLSDDNRNKVKKEVLDKYRAFGFSVKVVNVDCGWNSNYEAVQFIDIHKVLEDKNDWNY